MTLIELLIVIIILTTLVAAAIPIMSPSTYDRRIREASRGVNAFISAAQSKAIRTRRPQGVALKVLSQDTGRTDPGAIDHDNDVCLELFYVEEPPAFTGFSGSSRVMVAPNFTGRVMLRFVQSVSSGPDTNTSDGLPVGYDNDPLPPGLVRPGDVVAIGGAEYRLATPLNGATDADGDGYYGAPGNLVSQFGAAVLNSTGQLHATEYDAAGIRIRDAASLGLTVSVPTWTAPAQYSLRRQPVPTSAEPYQLPDGVAIDLRGSGTDTFSFRSGDVSPTSNFFVSNSAPIYIMFSPEGSIESVQFAWGQNSSPRFFNEPIASTVYFLIGRRENIPAPPLPPAMDPDDTLDTGIVSSLLEDDLTEITQSINWLNLESRWVAVGGQSGRVISQENAFVDLQQWATATSTVVYGGLTPIERRQRQIAEARRIAREMNRGEGR